MFHKIMKRFDVRAERFKHPQMHGECVDEEGLAEVVAMLAQRDSVCEKERELHDLPLHDRDELRQNAHQRHWCKFLSSLQQKNDNIAKVYAEYSQLSQNHCRQMVLWGDEEEDNQVPPGIIYREEHGKVLKYLIGAVTKAGFTSGDTELEAALALVKMEENLDGEVFAIVTVSFLEFRQILSLLTLARCEISCWPGTSYVREFISDGRGIEIPDARRTASCAAGRLGMVLEKVLLPDAAKRVPEGGLGDLTAVLLKRPREASAFYEASKGGVLLSHAPTTSKGTEDKTPLQLAVSSAGYEVSVGDLEHLMSTVRRTHHFGVSNEEGAITLNLVEFRLLLEVCTSVAKPGVDVIMFDDVVDIATFFSRQL
jgi:hypothetical protein